MTIREAITQVLTGHDEGLTCQEIYTAIIDGNLYTFNAANPLGIVQNIIRRQCYGVDFPSACINKYFRIVGGSGKKLRYGIYNQNTESESNNVIPATHSTTEELAPEEKIAIAHKEHLSIVQMQLKSALFSDDEAENRRLARLFERLVVELLSKMGYGYDQSAAKVTRFVKDGGIDGIIYKDRLGLEKIYVQAKRYSNTVPIGHVQAFMQVVRDNHGKNGIFITTSNFSKQTINKYGDSVKLIDGDELMNLLITYEVAVNVAKSYKTYTLDENYFNS